MLELAEKGVQARGNEDGWRDGPVVFEEHVIEKDDTVDGGRVLREGDF